MSVVGKRRKVVLGPRLAGTLMTPQEFDAVERYNENYRYELIHGVLVVSPLPLPQETSPNELLGNLLFLFREQDPRGAVLDCTLPEQYIATTDSRRRADRVIWVGLGRLPDLQKDLPTIVVEFVSKAKRDRDRDYIEKRAEYLALGITAYWIVDRFRRTLTVCRPGAEDLVVPEGETYRPPQLPGFELPLARLLAAADAWERRGTA
jgi:Uma2 family endonuclease